MEAVEPSPRRTIPSLEESFSAHPFRYTFHQAVRIIEGLYPDTKPLGNASDPTQEPVRLRSRVYLTTPGSDVALYYRSTTASVGPANELVVNFMGLAGIQGPLPMFVTESILERVQKQDYAMRDFLDLFNHRLLSLFRKSGRQYTVGVANVPADRMALGEGLLALLGLDFTGLRHRMNVDDRGLLPFSGLFWQRPRSLAGLRTVLASYFKTPVSITSNVGQWIGLAASECTRLGKSGQHQTLGGGASLGMRIWDNTVRFHMTLGPLSLVRYRRFFEDLAYGQALCNLALFYAGPEHDFTVHLKLKGSEIPSARLGRGSCLGYTTWLATKSKQQYEDFNVFLYTKRFENVNLTNDQHNSMAHQTPGELA